MNIKSNTLNKIRSSTLVSVEPTLFVRTVEEMHGIAASIYSNLDPVQVLDSRHPEQFYGARGPNTAQNHI